MKLKNRLAVWIFSWLSSHAYAQQIKETIVKADSLMQVNKFDLAENLYDRIVFFADSNQKEYIKKTAICKVALNKYAEAAQLFDLLIKSEKTDSLYYTYMLQKSLCLLIDNQNEQAQLVLREIRLSDADQYFQQKSYLLDAILSAKLLDFVQAQNNLQNGIDLLNKKDSSLWQQYLEKNKNSSEINTKMAGFYSAIIPGLGQSIYGDYKNGIISLAIHTVLVSAFIYTGNQYNYLISSMFFSTLIPRYYIGGINAAKNSAQLKIKSIQQHYLNQYLSIYLTY
jgi:hypothetical protein